MDILSHALAGGMVGLAFGNPLLGVAFGVLPDLVLGVRRRVLPNRAYNYAHSLLALACAGLVSLVFATPVPALAYFSHLLLDYPTHGPKWAPPLAYPWSERRFGNGEEWEWFSKSWMRGFYITLIWSLLWFNVFVYRTGYLS